MKMFKTTAAALTLAALTCTNAIAASNTHGMQIAVIQGALGSDEILDGKYVSAKNNISNAAKNNDYEHSMGLCVANIKLAAWEEATKECTKSIDKLRPILNSNGRAKYLMSVTYSNRAIARYLASDSHGALDDLSTALLFDNNKLVKNNLLQLKRNISISIDTYSGTTSSSD